MTMNTLNTSVGGQALDKYLGLHNYTLDSVNDLSIAVF